MKKRFLIFFRMSCSSMEELHDKLQPILQHQNTKMRNCIQPKEMIAVAFRYFAGGCTFTDLHYTFRMGISTISYAVRSVCKAITVLQEESIPAPSKEMGENIACGFEKKANFPHCIGAVDGKHIRVIKPSESGSLYFNYKNYFSAVLMAVMDTNYTFVYVNVGSYGKDCDSSIFGWCNLWRSILDTSLELPSEKLLPGIENIDIPYFFLDGEGFALHQYLLRPFGGKLLDLRKRVFNYRHCRERRYVGCAIGILSNKWRIFHWPLNVEVYFAVDIVKACIILHNFVRKRDEVKFEETLTISSLEELLSQQSVRGGMAANNVRSLLADYFLAEHGSVPWQMNKI